MLAPGPGCFSTLRELDFFALSRFAYGSYQNCELVTPNNYPV